LERQALLFAHRQTSLTFHFLVAPSVLAGSDASRRIGFEGT
jgi:hypothetical protein